MRRLLLTAAAALFASAIGYLVSDGPAGSPSAGIDRAPVTVVLGPASFGSLAFGSGEAASLASLRQLLGASTSGPTRDDEGGCGTYDLTTWPSTEVFFMGGRLVGYEVGGQQRAAFRTPLGLRIGDTVSVARRLYGAAFTTSSAQGGSWSIAPGPRRIFGSPTLIGSLGDPPITGGAGNRISSIAAGYVGCPATTP